MSAARSSSRSQPARRDSRRGFALLIVTTMLAFLVIVLLGLAVYTRIETSAAGNTQRQAQARENALLALNVAVGQLQKYAGPDQRVTATSEAFANRAGTRRYTGVWPTATTDDPDGDPLTPLTWLVSGNELRGTDGTDAPLAITPETSVTTANGVALVSTNTSRTANDVLARLMPITATGVPGTAATASTTIGRYAWWVGDQGVKAPVAVPDTSTAATYAPYDSADLRTRIRQQLAIGAGAAGTDAAPFFEPRDNNNSALVANHKVTSFNQLAFLRSAANGALSLTTVQQNFHAWSPNNFAVLANTKTGGLRQDLSLKPDLLGSAFAAWANYPAYMENPAGGLASGGEAAGPMPPAISPAYGADPLRRRYVMQPILSDAGLQHGVAPVLNYFLLSFNVRTTDSASGSAPLQARARWMISLWNPYTAALVPDHLRLEIRNLPAVSVVDHTNGDVLLGQFSLADLYGDPDIDGKPLNLRLTWDPSDSAVPDHQSWLPGRVMTWTSAEDKRDAVPSGGFASVFDTRNLNASARDGVYRSIGITGNGASEAILVGERVRLSARLYAVREGADDVLLATFSSPQFGALETTPQPLAEKGYQFSYMFRLAESLDTPLAPETWLLGPGRDPRRTTTRSIAYINDPSLGDLPGAYVNYASIKEPDRLLDRTEGHHSFVEDVPVFELPRGPLLSLGSLQHIARSRGRAFGIGNSWGRFSTFNSVPALELFDRFFFSGVTSDVEPAAVNGALALPNPLLRTLRNPETSAALTSAELKAAPDARSSKYLLQGGAFNVNSVNPSAWTAVLRGIRFPAPQSFKFLNLSTSTGTAEDTSTSTVQSSDAQFFRFAQSAQETYESADDDSLAKTQNFRRGMRTLTAPQVKALAEKIVALIKARHASLGPFRTLEEFLGPLPDSIVPVDDTVEDADPSEASNPADSPANSMAALGQSLLEKAIDDAGINTDGDGNAIAFSSQFLTQADVLTALAPVIFPRSDTFVIRSYGEAVNPAKLAANGTVGTDAIEGRAWCEAIVQRVPEYFDSSVPAETTPASFDVAVDPNNPSSGPTPAQVLNKTYGRRFKVISFRWLTRSDI